MDILWYVRPNKSLEFALLDGRQIILVDWYFKEFATKFKYLITFKHFPIAT